MVFALAPTNDVSEDSRANAAVSELGQSGRLLTNVLVLGREDTKRKGEIYLSRSYASGGYWVGRTTRPPGRCSLALAGKRP